jgi:protein-L-isoaspartate(D-aspartate) O-methyltransferase
LRYDNVHVQVGDGYAGWPEHAPFDKIIVTCSPEQVPSALVRQLKEEGLMVVPVGARYDQSLHLFTKQAGELVAKALRPTLFVPMTGAADGDRHVQPDPRHPTIANGSFEELSGDSQWLRSWHSARQMKRVEDVDGAREGRYYATFTNDTPGRSSQALQGFAVDGRHVAELDLTLWVKGEALRGGLHLAQWPRVVIVFYDQSRAIVGQASGHPWRGTFDWRQDTARIRVPIRAREAILHIGLLGAVGQISFDDLRLRALSDR